MGYRNRRAHQLSQHKSIDPFCLVSVDQADGNALLGTEHHLNGTAYLRIAASQHSLWLHGVFCRNFCEDTRHVSFQAGSMNASTSFQQRRAPLGELQTLSTSFPAPCWIITVKNSVIYNIQCYFVFYTFNQYMCYLGIGPMTFALIAQCWPVDYRN